MLGSTVGEGPGRRWPAGTPLRSDGSGTSDFITARSDGLSGHDAVYLALRRMILSSEIEPGAWLRQQDVAASFRVSRTPVREAMRTLAQEGLVETVPHYGARVTSLTIEEFEELYALRSGIERLAARLTAQQVTAEQIPALRQALERLSALTHTAELPIYLREEWRFRLQCYQVTGRQRLLDQVIFLREHSERYIHLAYNAQARIDESFQFHVQLMEAFASNDGLRAEQILQSALQWTLKNAGPVVAATIAG